MLGNVDRFLAPLTWLAAAVLVVMLFAGPAIVAEDDAEPSAQEAAGAAPYATTETAAPVDGRELFRDNCGSCHTLRAADTSGAVGPELDGTALDAAAIESIVRDGQGAMPAFDGDLSGDEIQAIAEYVAAP